MADHDVIVVGAGPVGLLLGCLLASRGLDVMVSDRRHGVDERTRAIGIHPPGLAALDAAGIGRAVRDEGVRLERGEVHARGRRLASVRFGERRPVIVLPQPRTGALLRTRLRTLGVAVRGGREAVGLRQDGTQVVVRTRSVERSGADAEDESTASFLIAADGVHSALRQQLGIGWLPVGGSGRYSMIDVPDAGSEPIARLHCEPTGLVEAFPLPNARRRWVLRHPAGIDQVSADRFARELHGRIGVDLALPEEPTAFLAAQHRADRVVYGRVVLLGDAAHEVSPIGGQGMNLGWADALRLAPRLVRAVERGDAGLGGFERRAARAAADVHRRARFYMSVGQPAGPGGQRAREGMIRMLGAPPLRAAAAGLVTMRGV